MAPRKRKKGRESWPENLYAKKTDRGDWFYYRRPDLPPGHPNRNATLGYIPVDEAIDATKQANAAYGKGANAFAKISGRTGMTLDQYIDIFLDTHLADRRIKGEPLSQVTITEYHRVYGHIKADPGMKKIYLRPDATPTEITRDQAIIAHYLNQQYSPETHNKHRTRLIDLYKHAVSDGLIPENIPARILPKPLGKKVRQRLAQPTGPGEGGQAVEMSIDAYNAIFEKAERPIQIAMELALNALQRRMELYRWRYDWSHDDPDGRHVYITISKTRKHGPAAFIRIPEALPLAYSALGCQTLGDLIAESRKDMIGPPHLVHAKPKRKKKSKEKEHHCQLSKKQITDGFKAARDAAGIYDHLEPRQRPTIHELIATGEYLREKQGWRVEDIQQLRGHTKTETTKIYLEGHEFRTIVVPSASRS